PCSTTFRLDNPIWLRRKPRGSKMMMRHTTVIISNLLIINRFIRYTKQMSQYIPEFRTIVWAASATVS
ncbi:MAG: hypothetical protein OEW40_20815, partial [Cyclobacteriaceae bacterium]|nr:hypothetical protein [Cyclobacteriaceae bacterium]